MQATTTHFCPVLRDLETRLVCSPVQTHRVPLGAVFPEEYMRPDGGGLCGESWTASGRLTFLITFPEVGLACLRRAVT